MNVSVKVTVVPRLFVVVTVDRYSPEASEEDTAVPVVVVLAVAELEAADEVATMVALSTVCVRVTVTPLMLVVVNTVVKDPVFAVAVVAAAAAAAVVVVAVAGSHIVV